MKDIGILFKPDTAAPQAAWAVQLYLAEAPRFYGSSSRFPFGANGGQLWFGQSDLSPDQILTSQDIIMGASGHRRNDERSSGERSNDERFFACSLTPYGIKFIGWSRRIYYRPYQEDGAIESRSPAYSNDRFIGRILSKAVTPPHTAASLKSHLCKIEGFSGSENAHLYSSLLSQTILDNSSRLALMNRHGPGSSEKEPMVLLIKNVEKRSTGGPQTPAGLPENPLANIINYVYYRYYNKEGETTSKTSFDEDDPALGRINSLSVAPPFNISSLKARLAEFEGFGGKHLQLFEDLSGDSPMSDSDTIALFTDQHPGSTADEPMAFICLNCVDSLPASKPPEVETQIKLITDATFGKSLPQNLSYSVDAPVWLPIVKGEILFSDGIKVTKKDYKNNSYEGYMATNSAGKHGFVLSCRVKQI
ncbi:uncharacterized protein LACBIDRAFT_329075 [Laccaria bicolor S238N-H82]|uniref:Predicted protein n=1 Tax=Laccaria bicolor (strain S238N-H82 / ATCC MYA-4686) TaxID=486041 RepID=B0DGZ2_LACBS|nr:uncharacterized protein LACBIDRAFT_329075 [Laccaria bicolor S238N-H82]EDR06236.1 predicted protein [Laccaria bicolor S238N-H82]|eukprot:XP_001883097.1 predicted protein [Laccaria bicolor S238N-H82]